MNFLSNAAGYCGRGNSLNYANGITRLNRVNKFCTTSIVVIGLVILVAAVVFTYICVAGQMNMKIPLINVPAPNIHPIYCIPFFIGSFVIILGVPIGINRYHKWLGEQHNIQRKDYLAYQKREAEAKKAQEGEDSSNESEHDSSTSDVGSD